MKVVKNKNKKKKNYIKKLKTKFNEQKKEIKLNLKKQSKKINKLKKINIRKEFKIFITNLKKIDFKKESKKIIKKIIEYSKKYYYIFLMAMPFILIDIITRIIGQKINFYGIIRLVPNLFTIIWLFLFIGILYSLFRYNIFELDKNANFIKYYSGLFLPVFKLCLATIGVCVFYASASVGAFFILKEKRK